MTSVGSSWSSALPHYLHAASPLSTQTSNQEYKHRINDSQYTIDNWCEKRGNHHTGEWHRTCVRSLPDPWTNTDTLF